MFETAINNSYQILDLFKCWGHRGHHKSKLVRHKPLTGKEVKPGKCKCFTEEEILVYKLKNFKSVL